MKTRIEKIGNKIHRPVGSWTEQIHHFLDFLHKEGFVQVPKPLGFDEQGREIVSFVQGKTCDYPLIEDIRSQGALCSSARLLRAYHDVSQKYLNNVNVINHNWMFPLREPQEVVCHNDFAPYNICFESQNAIGIIDFDAASPGPRNWDIAYALYRFAPLTNPNNEDGFGNLQKKISRAKLFCDSYGLKLNERVGLIDVVIERLQYLLDFLMQSAKNGNEKYVLNMKEGHHLKYFEDIKYMREIKLKWSE